MTSSAEERPNAARIYDYLIGGNHNFAADRAAADQVRALFPSIPNGMRMNRWFMHQMVEELSTTSVTCFLDLASGIPTEGYIHEIVPTAKVLYNDSDPVTVAYGRQIVGANPNVRYMESDLADIEPILKAAEEHFQGERRVAISMIGVAYFIPDAALKVVLQRLYDWCLPGSYLASSWLELNLEHPRIKELGTLYDRMGVKVYSRTPAEIKALLAPRELDHRGLALIEHWMHTPDWYQPEDENMQNGYAALCVKA